ncbi:MAG TPA: 4a-hydroxytetrahydrobiopterin dehydratase [Armatimonadota bacterium]
MSGRLSDSQIEAALLTLPGWTRDGGEILKTFKFTNFVEAMGFVNRVAAEAEAANHHPDIDIRWNSVRMVLSTHSQGGLTQKDIHLANRIEAAARPTL